MNFEILNVSDYEIGQKSSTSRCRNEYTNREEEEKNLLNMLYSNEFFWLVSFCFDETSLSSLCVCVCVFGGFFFINIVRKPQQSPATNSNKFRYIYQLFTSFYLSSVIH